jgi:hypothetical protein
MKDYPKFFKIHKMFHGKFVTVTEVQLVIKTQTIITNVNVMDVNVTTRSKATEERMFKDIEPMKTTNVVEWEKE